MVERREQVLKWGIVALTIFCCGYIVSASFLSVNGAHAYRQSDAYAHILGFLGTKGFEPYERFVIGMRAIYDIPIYQAIVAAFSRLTDSDPLMVVRFVNAVCWVGTMIPGVLIARRFGETAAGFLFVFFLSVSPLALHYYSVPLPDVLAIALSMVGLAALFCVFDRDESSGFHVSSRGLVIASPFLGLATLIKSPIAFAVLVFYLTVLVINFEKRFLEDRRWLAGWGGLLAVLAIVAVGAESLRMVLVGQNEVGFSRDPEWYFGTWNLRTSDVFWQRLWGRFHGFGPSKFGYIFFVLSVVAIAVRRNRATVAWLAASGTTFFSGWLIFASVYKKHDYYQLPVAVLFYLTLGICCSVLLNAALSRTEKTTRWVSVVVMVFVTFSFFFIVRHDDKSTRKRASIYPAMEYALRKQKSFLYVQKRNSKNPVFGAKLGTRFDRMRSKKFESRCEETLEKHNAVLKKGRSKCLETHRGEASYYIADGKMTFWMREKKKKKRKKKKK